MPGRAYAGDGSFRTIFARWGRLLSCDFRRRVRTRARKLAAAQKPALDALLGKQGLKMLFSVPWPPQGIFSAKAINSGADLKGVFENAGAVPAADDPMSAFLDLIAGMIGETDENWSALLASRSGIGRITQFDASQFDVIDKLASGVRQMRCNFFHVQ